MANGLFNTQNNAAQVMMLMEAERAKRIRDAGAGMDPIVASMARAQAGMRESVGDLARAGAGLFGMKMPQDPRLSLAMKRDKDRNEMMQLLQGFAADGNITEDEVKIGYTQLMRRGYMQEAKEFLQQAASMGTMRRAEAGEARAVRKEEQDKKMAPLEKEMKELRIKELKQNLSKVDPPDEIAAATASEVARVKSSLSTNSALKSAAEKFYGTGVLSRLKKDEYTNLANRVKQIYSSDKFRRRGGTFDAALLAALNITPQTSSKGKGKVYPNVAAQQEAPPLSQATEEPSKPEVPSATARQQARKRAAQRARETEERMLAPTTNRPRGQMRRKELINSG